MSAFNNPSTNLAGITVADLRRLGQAQGQRTLMENGLGLALSLNRGPTVDNPQTDSLAASRIVARNPDFMYRRLAEEERRRQADQADFQARQDAEAKRQDAEAKRQAGLQQASQHFQDQQRDEQRAYQEKRDTVQFGRQKSLIPVHEQAAEAARVATERRRQQSPEYIAEQQAKREAEARARQKQFDDHIAKIAGAVPTQTIMAPDASADDISTYDPNTGQEGFGVDEDLSAAIQTRMNKEGPAWETAQRAEAKAKAAEERAKESAAFNKIKFAAAEAHRQWQRQHAKDHDVELEESRRSQIYGTTLRMLQKEAGTLTSPYFQADDAKIRALTMQMTEEIIAAGKGGAGSDADAATPTVPPSSGASTVSVPPAPAAPPGAPAAPAPTAPTAAPAARTTDPARDNEAIAHVKTLTPDEARSQLQKYDAYIAHGGKPVDDSVDMAAVVAALKAQAASTEPYEGMGTDESAEPPDATPPEADPSPWNHAANAALDTNARAQEAVSSLSTPGLPNEAGGVPSALDLARAGVQSTFLPLVLGNLASKGLGALYGAGVGALTGSPTFSEAGGKYFANENGEQSAAGRIAGAALDLLAQAVITHGVVKGAGAGWARAARVGLIPGEAAPAAAGPLPTDPSVNIPRAAKAPPPRAKPGAGPAVDGQAVNPTPPEPPPAAPPPPSSGGGATAADAIDKARAKAASALKGVPDADLKAQMGKTSAARSAAKLGSRERVVAEAQLQALIDEFNRRTGKNYKMPAA